MGEIKYQDQQNEYLRIASVIVDIDTQALDSAYNYLAPPQLNNLSIGCSVLIPFGRKMRIGFVVKLANYEHNEALPIPIEKLKAIKEVLTKPLFNEEAVETIYFLANRYLAPLSRCVRLFTPPGGIPKIVYSGYAYRVEQPSVGEVDDRWVTLNKESDFIPKSNAVKQKAILDALAQGELRVAELATEYGSVSTALKSLEKQGAVRIERRRRMRGMVRNLSNTSSEYGTVKLEAVPTYKLTEGQYRALNTINQALKAQNGSVVLVDGVTGSGKTEVYLQAIEQVINQGGTAIVLVPEISLTPQTVARFRGRFGDMIAVLHSRMNEGERYDQWDYIRSGAARVVVGARSALFAPLKNLMLIVIDEEHEHSYKQDSAPRYVTRDVAAWMAQRFGASLVLGSATPSIESQYQVAKNSMWQAALLPIRANGKPMPEIEIIDMAHEFGKGNKSMFSKRLQNLLEETLLANHKAVLLLNQRGFAKFILCRDCGYVPECPHCSISFTYHEKGNRLICHHCGYTIQAPHLCPECTSPAFKKLGAGTQRVEAELISFIETLNKDIPVIRMDADTTKTKGAHQKLLEEFARPRAAVLLGTQMIAKGLDFEDVTLVGVINADTQLRLPDFRAAERTFALIEQVAGRAGRSYLEGKVVVQTYQAQAVPIQAAAHYDRKTFLKDELPKRKILKYPPYVRLVDVRIWGKNEQEVIEEATMLYKQLEALASSVLGPNWIILPPTPCVLSRLNNAWRYHITMKAPINVDVGSSLESVFRNRKSSKSVNVAVDIDPSTLL